MNGFAPLLEGFLAFALTMLALTTGVSAIVGALHHLRRRHARGLRDMVRLLYSQELRPLLGPPPGEAIPVGAGAVVVDKTAVVPHAYERLPGQDGAPPGLVPVDVGPAAVRGGPNPAEIARRAEFIYDMTIMPVPDVVEKLESRGADYWRKEIESAEKLVGLPWYRTGFHWQRLGRRWLTLRYSLDALKENEFTERFAASDLGQELRNNHAWTALRLPGWDELVAHLWKRFEAIGGASSETFARHSRSWSVAVGFLLAGLLNIDSLDLLNSYLTDPELRRQVLAESDTIRAQQLPAAADDSADASVLAPARAQLNAATTQLSAAAQALNGSLQALATAGTPEGQRIAATVESELQQLSSQVESVRAGLGALDEDVTQAERRIRGVTQSLVTSFPIGWTRFPNCVTDDSPDPRCNGRRFATSPAGTWALSRWSTTLQSAYTEDPEAFNQWAVGVLLTGLLLGLGSPFWVQAVTAAFNLRRWDSKTEATASASAPAGRPTSAVPAARADSTSSTL